MTTLFTTADVLQKLVIQCNTAVPLIKFKYNTECLEAYSMLPGLNGMGSAYRLQMSS